MCLYNTRLSHSFFMTDIFIANSVQPARPDTGPLTEDTPGRVIGLLGGPGIGKGYVTRHLREAVPQLEFLYRVTNRKPRATDPSEGVIALGAEFDTYREQLIGIHHPFEDERAYGWYVHGVAQGLKEGKHYITDPNIDLVADFHERFGSNLHLIGLTATAPYLLDNLRERFGKENGNLTEEMIRDITGRLETGLETNEKIRNAHRDGLIHSIIEVNYDNRDRMVDLIREDVGRHTNLFSTEGMLLSRESKAAMPLLERSYNPNYRERL